jgi:hypothetical protein
LPRTGENAINRKPAPGYDDRKALIEDVEFRLRLDLTEEAALVDPSHRHRRTEIDGIVYDRSEHGVMLAFAVDGDDLILLSFADLFDR